MISKNGKVMNWKIQDKTGMNRPKLFCNQCQRCMYTKEDIQSRESRGICHLCTEGTNSSDYRIDVVRIVLNDAD